jgi:hypothetical protein
MISETPPCTFVLGRDRRDDHCDYHPRGSEAVHAVQRSTAKKSAPLCDKGQSSSLQHKRGMQYPSDHSAVCLHAWALMLR